MAAELLDIENLDPSQMDDLPFDPNAATQQELTQSFSGQTVETDELPDKYRGKSIKDIVAMHQEAEKLIGRHSSEVGELRQYVDGFIKGKLAPVVQQSDPEPVDFFEDPEKAVSRAIESHPVVRQAAEASQQFAQQTNLSQLKQKHPDADQVVTNPSFMEWVQSSPVRRELFLRADRDYDFACADELISNFKERQGVVQQAIETETQSRQQAVRAASTGSAQAAGGNSGAKRIYRRADIIKLMKDDPDRYEALAPEIMRAYQENRVR